ncbi:MAG: class I SAM-dependent methyltransferase [Myxococcota bacterium]
MSDGGDRPHAVYDEIGRGYAGRRVADPRIGGLIAAALGPAAHTPRVLNVGAGAGSYEPADRRVVALEPSPVMLRQRPAGSAPAVRGSAVALPFADGCFDATLASLTLHHWPDPLRGLAEMRRVSRRQVIFCFDPGHSHDEFWLLRDYVPQIVALDARIHPSFREIEEVLGPLRVVPVPIPHDCSDGFLCAFWRRPEVYLDAATRRSISTFSMVDDVDEAMERLRRDLADGSWARRNADLLERESMDFGYRLLLAGD